MRDFDSYHVWLGIPPDNQPPHHYRLLGIPLFESSAEVIDSAADRQAAHVRTFQIDEYAADSRRILDEISAARICLLNPVAKTAYDEELRTQVLVPPPPPPPQSQGAPSVRVASFAPTRTVRAPTTIPKRRRTSAVAEAIKIVIGGIAGLGTASLILHFGFGINPLRIGHNETSRSAQQAVAVEPRREPHPQKNKPQIVERGIDEAIAIRSGSIRPECDGQRIVPDR